MTDSDNQAAFTDQKPSPTEHSALTTEPVQEINEQKNDPVITDEHPINENNSKSENNTEDLIEKTETSNETSKEPLTIEVVEEKKVNREDEPPALPPKNTNINPSSPTSKTTPKATTEPKKQQQIRATATIETEAIRTTMKTFNSLQEEANKKKKRR